MDLSLNLAYLHYLHMRMSLKAPSHTHFSYKSLRIAQIRKTYTDPMIWPLFTSDLRVVTCYYEIFTVYYGLLYELLIIIIIIIDLYSAVRS